MEEELAAGVGDLEVAQFVHDDEVESCDEVCKTTLLTITRLRLKPIDAVGDVIEAPACIVAVKLQRAHHVENLGSSFHTACPPEVVVTSAIG